MIETAKPRLILDELRCKNNISKMVHKANSLNIELRPHFKTHQSIHIGRWFRELNISGITVSSVDMAFYFASDGWKDLTIAFPFFPLQLPALQKLEKQASLRLFVNRYEDIDLLSSHLMKPFKVIVEINPGYGRSGIHYQNRTQINELISACKRSVNGSFHGFYIHDGRTYQSNSVDQIIESSQIGIDILTRLKEDFPESVLMMGDTPSASVRDAFGPISELSPGNFVFYDWMQVCIGACSIEDVALFCLLPVAQKFVNEKRAIVLGGAVHLSKEYLTECSHKSFGQAVKYSETGIKILEDSFISAVSQEHGTFNYTDASIVKEPAIMVCPIHSCLTANLHDHYVTTTGKIIEKRILS